MSKRFALMAEKKLLFAFVSAIFLTFLLLFFLASNENITGNVIVSNEEQIPKSRALTGRTENEKSSGVTSKSSNFSESIRLGYGIPLSVFENLPPMPSDFNAMVSLLHRNAYTTYDFFSEKYFLQPEFYPSFLEEGLVYWKRPEPSRYTVAGVGFFPGVQNVKVKRGSLARTRVFMHAAFGVRNYQGIKVSASFDKNCKGLSALILEDEFLLGPTYPKFDANWAKSIVLVVAAARDAESTICEMNLNIEKPSAENSSRWKSLHSKKYFEAADLGSVFPPAVIVKVE